MALDPNIILHASDAFNKLPNYGDIMAQRTAIQNQQQALAEHNAAYQQAQQDRAKADAAEQRGLTVGRLAVSGDMEGARKATGGDFNLIRTLDGMDEANRKRTFEITQNTAPLLLSLRGIPLADRPAALQQMAPQLQAAGFTPDHIQQLSGDLSDGALNRIETSAMTIQQYQESRKPFNLGQYESQFQKQDDGTYKMIAQGPQPKKYALNPDTGIVEQIGGPDMPGESGGGPTAASANTVYGNGKYATPAMQLSTMPMGAVSSFQRNVLIPATKGKIGQGPNVGTGAVGTYQITYGTLKQYGPRVFGANWANVPFTAENQDKLGEAIYNDAKGGDLHAVWAGMPSNAPGAYANVPWDQAKLKIAQVESGGVAPKQPVMGGKLPPGYQWDNPQHTSAHPIAGANADPGSVDMPAPKEMAKRNAAYPKVTASYKQSIYDIDAQIADLKALRNDPGLNGIVGPLDGRTPSVLPASTRAQAKLNKIMARGQFRALQDMRANSPTGGALGNVSDAEGRTLRQSVAALDQTQGEDSFKSGIDQYIADLEHTKANLTGAYEDTYSYRNGGGQSSAPAAMPSGFKVIRRVPPK